MTDRQPDQQDSEAAIRADERRIVTREIVERIREVARAFNGVNAPMAGNAMFGLAKTIERGEHEAGGNHDN